MLSTILHNYCLVMDQRINFGKSKIKFSPKVNTFIRQRIKNILHIREENGAWQYLGIPIIGKQLVEANCIEMVQQVHNRLEG